MIDTRIIRGVKGGVGTTTIAVALAANSARNGKKTLLIDATNTGDCSRVMGIVESHFNGGTLEINENLHLSDSSFSGFGILWDKIIVDVGTNPHATVHDMEPIGKTTLVSTLDYISLAHLMIEHNKLSEKSDLIVLAQDKRSLRVDDVRDLVDCEMQVVPYDLRIASTIDAGLFFVRLPEEYKELA